MKTLLPLLAVCLAAEAAAAGLPDAGNSVGKTVTDFTLTDYRGKQHTLGTHAAGGPVVVAVLGTECPLAKLYAPRLQELADQYRPQGVAFLAVDSNQQDSLAEIAAYARRHGLRMPVLKDLRNQAADALGATRTPEVFLLNQDLVVQYHGRIDDQYVVGIQRDEPTREDLRQAMDELLAGKPVSQPHSPAVGCLIGRTPRPGDTSTDVTYYQTIAPILEKRCVECHRQGEIGPFALRDFDQAAGWGEMIAEVVRERRMPPWHANPQHGQFANDRSMPEDEKRALYRWVENGCPAGDPADAPQQRTFTSGWQLPREPDQVFAMADRAYQVPAQGGPAGVPYQHFRVPTGFEQDRWIEAVEVQPGNRQVVHHIIVYAQPPGGRRRRDWIFLTAYVPGLRFDPLPEHSAKLAPAGSEFVFEMHYTPIGSRQEDISRLGVLFADPQEIQQEVVTAEVGNMRFVIPPFEPQHVVTASSRPLKQPVTLLSLSPHMHLRGSAFRYELATPDGEREVLLDVPAYDFNWQTRYLLSQPRELPRGAVIYCRAEFDNSPKNLANPDPGKAVRWGDQSWDEMMLGYFDVILPRDPARTAGEKPVSTGLDVVGLFDQADIDQSGGLTQQEARGHKLLNANFRRIDRNGDKELQLGEIIRAMALMMPR